MRAPCGSGQQRPWAAFFNMSKKLFVGGLSWNTTSDQLKEAFATMGPVTDAVVITDRETGRSRGFGFVTYGTEADAMKALNELNGTMLDGRAIKIDAATERTGGPRPGGGGGGFRPSGGAPGGGFSSGPRAPRTFGAGPGPGGGGGPGARSPRSFGGGGGGGGPPPSGGGGRSERSRRDRHERQDSEDGGGRKGNPNRRWEQEGIDDDED